MAQDLKSALALADQLAPLLAGMPWQVEDPAGYRQSKRALELLIIDAGGRVAEVTGPATAVRAYGFAATSTMGLAGAVRNWINQVRGKAGEAVPA